LKTKQVVVVTVIKVSSNFGLHEMTKKDINEKASKTKQKTKPQSTNQPSPPMKKKHTINIQKAHYSFKFLISTKRKII